MDIEKRIKYEIIGYLLLIILTLPIFPITILFIFKKITTPIEDYKTIKIGLKSMTEGNFDHLIEVSSEGELKELAHTINTINEGYQTALETKLKSEKFKTELITNVSHDLRTPLTSIISYIEILKKQKNPSENERYINILESKANQLKKLADDLFEASKVSSGNIIMNKEKIDILSLITQTLGELHKSIEKNGYDIIVHSPDQTQYVYADGKLLWRVIENLMSNILKYTLKGSRVYIDIENSNHTIIVQFKNISASKLNIPPEELMKRFIRGDLSRNKEGNGLGLSIVKNLVELQGGHFDIIIDGDLFKAIIQIPQFIEVNEPNLTSI